MDDNSKPIDPKLLDLILEGITKAGNKLDCDEPPLEMLEPDTPTEDKPTRG